MSGSRAARAQLPTSDAPGTRCPGCGKTVDPLRAGHVAIFDGAFLYYCDQTCKAVHLRAVAASLGDDVQTLDPPAVAERIASLSAPPVSGETARTPTPSTEPSASPTEVTSGVRVDDDAATGDAGAPFGLDDGIDDAIDDEPPREVPAAVLPPVAPVFPPRAPNDEASLPSAPPLRVSRRASLVAREEAAMDEAARGEAATLPSADEAHPATLRSPAIAPPTPNARAARLPRRDGLLDAMAVAGLAAGLAAPALAWIGAASAALPLVLVAVAAVAAVARLALAPRDAADVPATITILAVLGAAAAAFASAAIGGAHVASLVAFASLAAAGASFVELATARARRDVDAARERIARALQVPVRVVRGDDTVVMDAAQVKPGEEVLVEAEDVVGVDGVVSAGEATVSPWLGAAIEVKRGDGDPVVAGARVVRGRLRLRTTWTAQERAWSKLVLSPALRVDVASPLARAARQVATRGAPVAAIVVAAAAYANGAAPIEVLAAAAAGALVVGSRGVAGALALVHARGQLGALDHGVVYKDARAFDAAARTDVAVVCSRGTVLVGEPEIVALEAIAPDSLPSVPSRIDAGRLLALAAGAETASTHPFAAAILRAARARGERPDNVRSATVHAGLGVTALASNGEHLAVGSRALLLQEKISVARADARITELEAQGRSVLLVALGGKLVGLLALQDGLRAGARAAVQRLLDARIEPVLLSGEARETCETLGRALDIEHVRPEVLPADRGAEVRALAEGGHVVAVIGHPSTDDGALGAADVSVAMASAGGTPGEWGVALASDDVRDAALALSVAHATRDRARVAIALGFAPAVVALLAIAFGIAGLVAAPLAAAVGAVAALVRARDDGRVARGTPSGGAGGHGRVGGEVVERIDHAGA